MHFSFMVAVAALTLGCGRSDLLEDDSFPSGTTEADGSIASGDDASGMDATGPGHPGHPTSDASVDAGTTVGVPDAGAGAGSCTRFSCSDGCCQADGTCFRVGPDSNGPIPTSIPCGSNGDACVTCKAGFSCLAGGCQEDLGTTCTPENCSGCCLAANVNGTMSTQCFEGTQSNFCGKGGGQCQRCAPMGNGGQCVADPAGGADCVDKGQCNSTNCAGCCSGNLCVVGTQDIGCGSGAVACQDCTADGGLCMGVAPSSGVVQGCGYDCLAGFACNTFCPTASGCGPLGSFLGSGQ